MAPVPDLLPCQGQSGIYFVAGSLVGWVPGTLGLGPQVQVSEGSVSPGTCALLEVWPGAQPLPLPPQRLLSETLLPSCLSQPDRPPGSPLSSADQHPPPPSPPASLACPPPLPSPSSSLLKADEAAQVLALHPQTEVPTCGSPLWDVDGQRPLPSGWSRCSCVALSPLPSLRTCPLHLLRWDRPPP